MMALGKISKLLMLIPLAMFLYDVVKHWFVDAKFHVKSLEAWWKWASPDTLGTGRAFMTDFLSPATVNNILDAPGPLVLFIPPVILYLIYRITFAMKGGKNTAGYMYKSRY